MTQPNYAVPPNPTLAAALGNMNVPANWKSSAALRDYLRNVAENGISGDQALRHFDDLLTKVAGAQLEMIAVVADLQARLQQ